MRSEDGTDGVVPMGLFNGMLNVGWWATWVLGEASVEVGRWMGTEIEVRFWFDGKRRLEQW